MTKDDIPNSGKDFIAKWGESQQKAFDEMKVALTNNPVIIIPDPNKGYHVEIDASFQAIGAVLYQKDENNQKRVVSYMSKRLGKAQSRYDSGKLELLGLIVVLSHWKHYLLGAPELTIDTDNEALTSLRTTKNPTRMQQRWLHFIEQFSFTLGHRSGKSNIGADSLSRIPENTENPKGNITITEDGNENQDDLPDSEEYFQIIIPCEINSELFHLKMENSIEPGTGYNEELYLGVQKNIIDDKDTIEREIQKDLEEIRIETSNDEQINKLLLQESENYKSIDGFTFRIKENNYSLYIPKSLENLRKKIMYQAHYLPTA